MPPTFLDASRLAIEVLTSGYGYTHGKIVYNRFRTVVSYTLSSVPIFSLKCVEVSQFFLYCNLNIFENIYTFILYRVLISY